MAIIIPTISLPNPNLYSYNLIGLRNECISELGEDPEDQDFWEDVTINGYINTALRRITKHGDVLNGYIDNLFLESGKTKYELPSIVGNIYYVGIGDNDITLNQMNFGKIVINTDGTPTAWGRSGTSHISVAPSPKAADAGTAIKLKFRAIHPQLINDEDIIQISDMRILEEGVKAYVKWKMLTNTRDSYDIKMAMEYKNNFYETLMYIDILTSNEQDSVVVMGD
jgi:hypothetical protein